MIGYFVAELFPVEIFVRNKSQCSVEFRLITGETGRYDDIALLRAHNVTGLFFDHRDWVTMWTK